MEDKKEIGMGNPPVAKNNDWVKVERPGYTDEELKEQNRRKNIKNGMQKTLKSIGRPKKVEDETLKKAYGKWLCGQITQREIAEILGISERTVSRRFKKIGE